ncbi:universal stress protein [Geodermatophilus sp. SYSU D00697]
MTGPEQPHGGAVPSARPAAEDRRARVVVGVDGSPGSRAALVYALAAAAARRADLEVVSAYALSPYWTDPDVWDPSLVEALRAPTEERVAALLEEVRRDPAVSGAADVAVRTVAAEGPAAQELLRRSADADLLVVGSRGRGGVRSAMLGSVALHCVTHARCPVTVVHPMTTEPVAPARVVVGIDGSERSRTALVHAMAEAAQRGGEVEAVAAYELADHWTDMYSTLLPSADQIRAGVEEEATRSAREVRDGLAASRGDQPHVHVRVVEGAPHDVLVSRARGAALLVVGSSGRGELRSLLLGSVALHCAMHAPCPVMVVHPTADRPTGGTDRPQPATAAH